MNFQLPQNIVVVETRFLCRSCGARFAWWHSDDGSIVKFVSHDGARERWLPTYGEGGYLQLLSSLVPEWSSKQTITKKVADAFDRAFAELLKLHGCEIFIVERGKVCPICRSNELTIESENVIIDPRIAWLDMPPVG